MSTNPKKYLYIGMFLFVETGSCFFCDKPRLNVCGTIGRPWVAQSVWYRQIWLARIVDNVFWYSGSLTSQVDEWFRDSFHAVRMFCQTCSDVESSQCPRNSLGCLGTISTRSWSYYLLKKRRAYISRTFKGLCWGCPSVKTVITIKILSYRRHFDIF